MSESMGITAEELEDLTWELIAAFPEVDVNPAHAPDFWPAKATQLLPVINKIRDRARKEGREITLEEALEKRQDPHDENGNRLTPEWEMPDESD